MEKKIAGSNFYFTLSDEGLIECKELHVSAKTFDECLALAKSKVKEIDEEAKKNSGMTAICSSWNKFEVCTIGKEDGNKVWITNGNNERRKEDKRYLYVFDQSILDEIKSVLSQIKELENAKDEIKSRLTSLYSKEF